MKEQLTTSKLLDKLYKHISWIIIAISIFGYLAYRTLRVEGSIEMILTDLNTWLNIFFVIWLNLNIQNGAINSGISAGIESQEFKLADELNNKIIKSVNNELKDFRYYVRQLNKEAKTQVEDDYLFKCGVDTYDELTDKQKKKFNRLKPIRHDISGFNLPLYYDMTHNGEIKYESTFNKQKGIWQKRVGKILNGILFGVMSVNVVLNVKGLGEALISVGVISSGLIITYLLSFFPPMFKLKFVIPKGVLLKQTLYKSYVEYKTQTHSLSEFNTNNISNDKIKTTSEV